MHFQVQTEVESFSRSFLIINSVVNHTYKQIKVTQTNNANYVCGQHSSVIALFHIIFGFIYVAALKIEIRHCCWCFCSGKMNFQIVLELFDFLYRC